MKKIVILATFVMLAVSGFASRIERVEPMSWWTGMKTPLQIMLYGDDLQGFSARFDHSDVAVTAVNTADSPNYLFVDVLIADSAPEGDYILILERGDERLEVCYPIAHRRKGSASRSSFNSSDMVYMVMPDRFANGDPSNDSTVDTAEKVNRTDHHGRHGGDIQGIIDRLDYISELGATTLWSTPLLLDNEPTYSYHGYACADYYKIDPRYGTNQLYRKMVDEAHRRGIKVVMDVVTNHCGLAHWWVADAPFKDWIHEDARTNNIFSTAPDPNASRYDTELCSRGWFDAPMPDLSLENPYLLQYFTQVFVWWVESANIDGLRVDTYPYNHKESIAQWTANIRAEYPNLNIVGECWTSSPAMVAYWDGATKNRDGYSSNLPSVMDFPFQEAIGAGLSASSPGWGEGLMKVYNSLSHDFLYEDPRTLMTFLDNHDTERFGDLVKGDVRKMKLGLVMLATMRGVPQLYAGTEFMFRSADLSQGHGSARVDFSGGWKADKKNLFAKSGRNANERELFDFTKKLFSWRKDQSVVHSGSTTHFIPEDNVYVYFRHNSTEAVMVVVNGSESSVNIDWSRYAEIAMDYSDLGLDVLTDQKIKVGEPLTISPMNSMVIKLNK